MWVGGWWPKSGCGHELELCDSGTPHPDEPWQVRACAYGTREGGLAPSLQLTLLPSKRNSAVWTGDWCLLFLVCPATQRPWDLAGWPEP